MASRVRLREITTSREIRLPARRTTHLPASTVLALAHLQRSPGLTSLLANPRRDTIRDIDPRAPTLPLNPDRESRARARLFADRVLTSDESRGDLPQLAHDQTAI